MLSQSHFRDLLASYDFSEGTGTDLIDKSGNGNNATIVGGTWTADRFGRANRAVSLDGVDDYIDLGLADYQGDISAVISMKTDPSLFNRYFIVKGSAALYPSFFIYNNGVETRLAARHFNEAGTLANNNLFSRSDMYGDWGVYGLGYNSGASALMGIGQQQSQQATINTDWKNTEKILVGTTATLSSFTPMTIDRIFLFNTFKSGHELSKIANRLKLGDIAK
jgi:hypothetical protein